jgi:hypothetical protein
MIQGKPSKGRQSNLCFNHPKETEKATLMANQTAKRGQSPRLLGGLKGASNRDGAARTLRAQKQPDTHETLRLRAKRAKLATTKRSNQSTP